MKDIYDVIRQKEARIKQLTLELQALRVVQVLCVLFAAYVGVLAASGRHATDKLFYLYALLPIAVSFVAEQLRIASAQIDPDFQWNLEVRRTDDSYQAQPVRLAADKWYLRWVVWIQNVLMAASFFS